jgi:hypothetical protein
MKFEIKYPRPNNTFVLEDGSLLHFIDYAPVEGCVMCATPTGYVWHHPDFHDRTWRLCSEFCLSYHNKTNRDGFDLE